MSLVGKGRTMPAVVRPEWFGQKINVLMVNGKSATGELVETGDSYIVIKGQGGVQTQIMAHAIIAVRLAGTEKETQ